VEAPEKPDARVILLGQVVPLVHHFPAFALAHLIHCASGHLRLGRRASLPRPGLAHFARIGLPASSARAACTAESRPRPLG
jgi:hypothetical protein